MRERKKPRISWVTKTKWILKMEKIKNAIKSAYQWLNKEGGMLHILACYALMLTFSPMVGVWWSLAATIFVALLKEFIDFFIQKGNDKKQVIHDLIMDAAGIILAAVIIILWFIRIW